MKIVTALAAVLIAGSGFVIVPRGISEAQFLLGPRDEAAAAGHGLSLKSAQDYDSAARLALNAGDEDLAASIADLAAGQGAALSPALRDSIATAQDEASARTWSDAWDGFVSGDAPTGAAFGGSLAADLVGYGDLRDLYGEAGHYIDGQPIDLVTVGFAGAGLGLTAATIASFGSTSPERAGLSVLKAAKRTGKLSPLLARELGVLAADAVDTRAFAAAAKAVGAFDLAAARNAAKTIIRPQALKTMAALGGDVTTIGTRLGYRGTLQSLALAKSPKEISAIAKLSERFGGKTRGVLAMLGGAALTAAGFTVTAAAWTFTALLWLGFAALFTLRFVLFVVRLLVLRQRLKPS